MWPMLVRGAEMGFVSLGCDAQSSSEELACAGKPRCPHGGKPGDLGSHSALGRGCSCGAAAPEVSAISTRGLENKQG